MKMLNRKSVAAIFIVVLVALSSTRVVDDYTDDYTNEALTNAAFTYATVRGINAIVSMVQSSSVEAGIGVVSGSITIGELLDPLNDMIERFSTVMTWVLASLAAQKVLLLIASHQLFLYLVAVLGISALLMIFYGQAQLRGVVFRVFLVIVFVRFALGFAVALNSGVDLLFLQDQLRQNDQQISEFQSRIIGLEPNDSLDTRTLRDSLIAFWQSLSLAELNRKISAAIENFINLVAIYLLKTILFPLGFFYASIYVIRALWRLDLTLDTSSPTRPEPNMGVKP